MGLLDKIRNAFSKSNEPFDPVAQLQEEESKKSELASNILNSITKIKRINSLDRSLWNLSNLDLYELKNKRLTELEKINRNLDNRLQELKTQKNNYNRDSIEESKWTGQMPKDFSKQDFDRLQRSDDGR